MLSKKTVAAAIVGTAALFAVLPASAQTFSFDFGYGVPRYEERGSYNPRGALSPREVRRALRDQGYRNIDYVDRRGSIYQVRATSPRGGRVGLVVSARNGAILNRYRL